MDVLPTGIFVEQIFEDPGGMLAATDEPTASKNIDTLYRHITLLLYICIYIYIYICTYSSVHILNICVFVFVLVGMLCSFCALWSVCVFV